MKSSEIYSNLKSSIISSDYIIDNALSSKQNNIVTEESKKISNLNENQIHLQLPTQININKSKESLLFTDQNALKSSRVNASS